MFRTVLVVAAAMLATACVTPRTLQQQTPTVAYKTSGKTLVGVVEQRERVKEGKPPNFAGYVRTYGMPVDWTVDTLTLSDKSYAGRTMSTYLADRIAGGLKASGSDAVVVSATRVPTDAEAEQIMSGMGASKLITIVNRDWHFDVNTNWVGKFQFNSDVEVVIQKAGKGTVLRKTFAEKQAIQAKGEESWPNLIVDAYKAKLEQVLSDSEVRAALEG